MKINPNLSLIITFILLGFAAIIAQTVYIREFLVVFFGNEVSLGVIFACWLMGIAFGASVGAFVTDRIKWPLELLALILIAMCLILPGEIYFIRLSRSFLDIPVGQHIPFRSLIGLSLFGLVPFSFFIGAAFPVACKIYQAVSAQTGDPAVRIGWVYIWESLGSLVGGVVFAFLLVEKFNAFQIAFLAVCLISGAVWLLLRASAFPFLKYGLKAVNCFLFFGGLYCLLFQAGPWHHLTVQRRWQSLNEKIILRESLDSKYENLGIGEYEGQKTLYGNGHPVFSFPDDYTYAPLADFLLTEHPAPQDVLLIGGNESLLKEMLKHPLNRIDYVQLDPKAIELIAKYLEPSDRRAIEENRGKKIFIHYVDGRYFVKHTAQKYDLVIINMPDPATAMVNRFYTVDFFREVKLILKNGGVVATRSQSAVNYFGEEIGTYVGSLYDTVQEVFRYVLVTPGTEAHILAADTPETITFDLNVLDRRFKERGVNTDYFIPPFSYEAQFQLQPNQIKFTADSLAKRKDRYLNTDLKPVTYFFNLVLWDTITQAPLTSGHGMIGRPVSFFKNLIRLKFEWLIAAIVLLLAFRLFYVWLTPQRKLRHRQFNSLLAMFAVGFAGLSLELVLLFSFQNIYGYIYQKIGLIIALFMCGLAAGGWLANRFIMKPERNWNRVLIWIEIILILFAGSLPYILKLLIAGSVNWTIYLISEYLFILLVMAGGLVTGLVYPVVNKLYLISEATGSGDNKKIGKAAGLIDSADHLGACLGALLTGIIFVPLFGIELTCWFVVILNAASLFCLWWKPD